MFDNMELMAVQPSFESPMYDAQPRMQQNGKVRVAEISDAPTFAVSDSDIWCSCSYIALRPISSIG